MFAADHLHTEADRKDLVDSQWPRDDRTQAPESKSNVAQDAGPLVGLDLDSLGSFDTPSRPRTIWEMMQFRHRYTRADLKEECAEPAKFRQNLDSKFLGHHPWDKEYYEKEKADRTPLSAPRWEAHPYPHALYDDLQRLIFKMDECDFSMHLYWDWPEVLRIRKQERKEFSARNHTRAEAKALRHLKVNCFPDNIKVFHTRLHKVLLYTATDVVFRGYTHEIPILVHSLIQQLLARGIHDNTLFKAVPTEAYDQLVDTFNEGPSFGDGVDITFADTRDVAGLLVNFIINLKDNLLPLSVSEALFQFSVDPTCRREAIARTEHIAKENLERRAKYQNKDKQDFVRQEEWDTHLNLGPVIWIDDYAKARHDDLENKSQIPIAAALLRFTPSSHMSLLDYLMTFFMKTIATPRNTMQAKDIARMFAYPIIGGSSKPISLVTFLWLLDRWPRLADLIFSKPPEEPKHGYERYYEGVSMAAPIDEQLASLEKTLVQLTNSRRGLGEADKKKDDGQTIERASFSSNFTKADEDAKGVKKTDLPDLSLLNINHQDIGHVKPAEGQSDAVGLLYSLVLEERARTARLERKLSDRERERKELDARKRQINERNDSLEADNPDAKKSDEEEPLTMRQKIVALLNTSTILDDGVGGGL